MPTNSSIINAVKSWIFPTLLSIVSYNILTDLNQIKTDIRLLMAQSNIDKTRIDNLERRVTNLETSMYMKTTAEKTVILGPIPSRYFIKEEELDINKYLRKRV